MTKAVILARGLGTRMRQANDDANITAEQAAIAAQGIKALIPIDRPFLDYVLHDLAEAGYEDVCLVIGPEHDRLREYYGGEVETERLRLHLAVQEEPRGTADAVAAVEEFAGEDSFLVINSDNYYPLDSLAALRVLDQSGLSVYEREAMIAQSNIDEDRISKFAVVKIDETGCLAEFIEKPSDAVLASLPEPVWVSMNCWRFGSKIFDACRAIKRSPRGELELPDAVQYSIEHLGEEYRVLRFAEPVLDLTSRADVATVTERLSGKELSL